MILILLIYWPALPYVTCLPLLLPFPPTWTSLHPVSDTPHRAAALLYLCDTLFTHKDLTPYAGLPPLVEMHLALTLALHAKLPFPQSLGSLPHPSAYCAEMSPMSLLSSCQALLFCASLSSQMSSSSLSGFSILHMPSPRGNALEGSTYSLSLPMCKTKLWPCQSTAQNTFRRKTLIQKPLGKNPYVHPDFQAFSNLRPVC